MANDTPIQFELELGSLFRDVTLSEAMRGLSSPQDIEAASEIVTRRADERQSLKDVFEREYEDRVAEKRAELFDQRSGFDLPPPSPDGIGSTTDQITQAARRLVEAEHQADLMRSTEGERAELDALMANVAEHHATQGLSRSHFEVATRQGPQRSQD